MARRRGYGVIFALTVVVLAVSTFYTVATIEAARRRPRIALPPEGTDTFSVRFAGQIRPRAADYARFAAEDAAWRRHNAPAVSLGRLYALEFGGTWRPSARQVMLDSAYHLAQRNDLAGSAALLDAWVRSHPRDAAEIVELARLLVQLGREDDAFARYRQRLALSESAPVRAEYAFALLSGKRYGLAAEEYRRLLAADPRSASYRLGLARALWWGEKPREAEREIARLVRETPRDTTLGQMLVAVRSAYDPTATEAEEWVRERPSFGPYRLAFARALVQEKQGRRAAAQMDTLLAMQETPALLREAAGVHAEIGDSLGNARLLGRLIALQPQDSASRRLYAEALSWAGDREGAISQWSALVAAHATPERLLARGRLYVWQGNTAAGARDLVAANRLRPTYEAFALLGDVYRWGGEFRRAHEAYAAALALRPGDLAVLGSLRLLVEAERVQYAVLANDEIGWTSLSTYSEDNAGYLYLATGIARGVEVGRGTVMSVGAEQRRVSRRSFADRERYIYGYGVEAAVARVFGASAMAVRGGVGRYATTGLLPEGSVSLQTGVGRVRGSVEVSSGPSYRSLQSTGSLARLDPTGRSTFVPLTGTAAAAALTAPVGGAEVTTQVERLWLSDANARTSVQGTVRWPIASGFSAMYNGGTLGFDRRSDDYWDPERYVSHAIGVEYARRHARGLSLAARVLPGVGRATEVVGRGASEVRIEPRNVPQLATGGELAYRASRWDAAMTAGYTRGSREGAYEALNGTFRIHLAW